ncbi:MAG: hypothetical protein ACUZ8I_14960 [Candidatus Scalindua sp.]
MNNWHKMISNYVQQRGTVVRGMGLTQFHHVAGRTYKQNKIHIGGYFIIPLPFELHDISSDSLLNVTHYRNSFTKVYGNQRDLWLDMIEWMQREGWKLPFGQDVIDAVMQTKY